MEWYKNLALEEIYEENSCSKKSEILEAIEQAVETALRIASEEALIFLPHLHYHNTKNVNKQSILSLKDKVLKELEVYKNGKF